MDSNENCVVTIVVTVIIIILFIWCVWPMLTGVSFNEGFNMKGYVPSPNARVAVGYNQMELSQQEIVPTPPYFSHQTLAVMDGGRNTNAIMNNGNFEYRAQKPWDQMDYQELEGYQHPPWKQIYTEGDNKNMYLLDDGGNGNLGLQYDMCSKSCCSNQWPTPFKLPTDPLICANKDKFMPSPYFCNNGFQDSGCLCMTKPQYANLMNRGNNA
ncbi:MAG: hypothetical protein Edafosvirus8_12 [Edafosvirus sp.]|uniref:Uncharacterized protein n=1 Tax=Edafosvirus sp. TaxID=2487765 RepID=A0A3G4ZTN4_9VIRU|nr:MAG: hypothetical protein Edafosvirus8_12 [Edafosvirus sp.]